MMKKNNKILIICLVLLITLSVGYALFSDTITINGTATAKGEFSLTTTCDENVEAAWGDNGEYGLISNAKISCDNNVVAASATLGAPGSYKWFRVKVTNTGSIPAKLKKAVELNNPDWMIVEKDNNYGFIENTISNSNKTSTARAELWLGLNYLDNYETDDSTGVDFTWYDEVFDAVLDPGETAYFYVYIAWDHNSTNNDEPLSPTLNAKLTWEQITE